MPTEAPAPVILWFRNDLRLHDHAALTAAVQTGRPVLPVYVLDEAAAGAWAPGGASSWWLHHSLASLAKALAERGSRLVLRRGDTARVLAEIAGQIGADAIHTAVPVEPWARAMNGTVAKALPNVVLHAHRTATLFDLPSIRTHAGGVYGVFTPFSRACRAHRLRDPLSLPRRFETPRTSDGDQLEEWRLLPTKPDWAGGLRDTWQPGEAGAHARLKRFLHALHGYAQRRNLPGEAGTSMLSPHLHWGEISPVQVWHAADHHAGDTSAAGRDAFLNELLWREFSAYLLWHHPTLPDSPLRTEFAHMPWRRDATALAAWQRGQTGVPIVDAGMRQLWQTGWMHNRVRMIVGSFLVKHLLLPWQAGEAWFWDTLCDADLASNAASWQWIAGCGADAAPFFRVFNPVLQGQKFDSDGAYVRRFVPELATLDARHIHAPWDAPPMLLRSAGVTLGQTYPLPIVDLAAGRQRALDAFRTISRAA
jgi:deoxyribodipyrimidine photo-lyase